MRVDPYCRNGVSFVAPTLRGKKLAYCIKSEGNESYISVKDGINLSDVFALFFSRRSLATCMSFSIINVATGDDKELMGPSKHMN